jgi:ABC-type transport system substrate-binding protein
VLSFWAIESNPVVEFEVALDATRPLPQGDFYVGAFTEPQHVNPFTSKDVVALSYVLRFTHDCLQRIDFETGKVVPGLAAIEAEDADGLGCTLRLRDDLQFSDGRPLTMEDVEFTYAVLRDDSVPPGAIHTDLAALRGFERLDDRRFRLRTGEAHFLGFDQLTTGYRVVQREWFLRQIALRAAAAGRPVPSGPGAPGFGDLLAQIREAGPATGPYRIARGRDGQPAWHPHRDLWLVQNPRSWQRLEFPRRWNLAGMRLRFLTDRAAQVQELRGQRLDWYMGGDIDGLLAAHPELDANFRRVDYDSVRTGPYFIVWNHDRPRLGDVRVRKALTMLFDRATIAAEVFDGNAAIATSWFPPGSPAEGDLRPLAFDPAEAADLLQQAGCTPEAPLRVQILAEHGRSRYRRILDIAKPAFLAAGVELHARLLDWSAMLALRKKGEFDGFMMTWAHSPLGVDPHEFFHSNPDGRPGGRNYMRYVNEDLDALLLRARRELDEEARLRLFQECSARIHADQPITFLVRPKSALLLHRRFRDAAPGSFGVYPERWWVPYDEQLHRPPRR